MNLILCGFPGCGKTTVGKWIATHESKDFIDTDREVEKLYLSQSGYALNCREIYLRNGEKQFRQLEHQVVNRLLDNSNCIIATGGGILTYPENISLLKNMGALIYLKKDVDTLFKQLTGNGIPAYLNSQNTKNSFDDLYKTRAPLYESVCDFCLETTNLSNEDIYYNLKNSLIGVYGQ